MWGMLALAFVIVYLHRVAPSVVADRLMESFAVKEGAVLGSLAAMYFYIYMLMQLPAGLLVDTMGPRNTVVWGMIAAGLGSLVFAASPTLSLAFVGRALVGLGVSVIFVSILKFQAVWFLPNEFAFLTGMTQLMGNAGAVLAATPLALLVNAYGWRFSFALVGMLSFVVALACRFLVKDSPGEPVRSNGPLTEKLLVNLGQLKLVLKNRHTWPPFVAITGIYGTVITFQGIWGVPYLMQVYGFTRTGAANLMLTIALGMMAGSPLVGFVSDRTGRRKLPYVAFVLCYLFAWLLMVFWNQARPPQAALYPLYFCLGFFGSVVAVTFAAAKEVNPLQGAGTTVAAVNMGGFFGISVLQPLLGYLLDLRWQGVLADGVKVYPQEAYYLALRFCLYPIALSMLASLLIRETRGSNCYEQNSTSRQVNNS